MRPYNEWLMTARRWDAAVDYGSPITAWSLEMLEVLRECNGDKKKAQQIINQRKLDAKKVTQ